LQHDVLISEALPNLRSLYLKDITLQKVLAIDPIISPCVAFNSHPSEKLNYLLQNIKSTEVSDGYPERNISALF
jgi:hypothetical protein